MRNFIDSKRRVYSAWSVAIPLLLALAAALTSASIPEARLLLTAVSILGGFMFSTLLFIAKESLTMAETAEKAQMTKAGHSRRRAMASLADGVAHAASVAFLAILVLALQLIAAPADLSGFRDLFYVPSVVLITTHLLLVSAGMVRQMYSLILGLQEFSGATKAAEIKAAA